MTGSQKKPFSSLQAPALTSVSTWTDRPAVKLILGDIFRPDDTPETRQQKVVIGAGLIASVVPIAYFALLSARLADAGWYDGLVLSWVAMLLLFVSWLGIHLVTRASETFWSFHFDLWVILSTIAALLLAVSFPAFPIGALVAALAMIAGAARASLLPLHLVFLGAVYAVGMVNAAFAGSAGAPSSALCSTPYAPNWKERLGWQANVLVLVFGAVVLLVLSAADHSNREAKSRRESLLTRVVCEELCRLNAGGAIIALRYLQYENGVAPTLKALQKDHANREGGTAEAGVTSEVTTQGEDDTQLGSIIEMDDVLLARLQLLIDRFDRFLPHLPNWLVTSTTFTGSQLVGGIDSANTEGALAEVSSPVQQEPDLDMESLDDFATAESDTPRDGSDNTPRAMRTSLTQVPPSPVDKKPVAHWSKTGKDGRFAQVPTRLSGRDSNHSTGSSEMLRHRSQKISYAWLDFSRESNSHMHQQMMSPLTPHYGAGTPKLGDIKIDVITQFVDAVHEAADATYGAVHKFVGDAVEVSWNTVRVTAQCEAKAARFMALLRQFSEAHFHHFTVTGAAVTGDAYTVMSGTKQQALTISYPTWRRALKQLTIFAHRCGMLLIDDPTFQVGHYTVEARAIDLVRLSRWHDSTKGGPGNAAAAADRNGRKSARRASFGSAEPTSARPPGLVTEDVSSLHHFADYVPAQPVTRTMHVYEALRDLSAKGKEVTATTGDQPEEWMYTLANSERQSTIALRKALDLVDEDKFSAAQNVLQTCIDSTMVQSNDSGNNTSANHAVRRLLGRLQQFAETNGTTSAEFAEDLTRLA